jgi:hypothetical protein
MYPAVAYLVLAQGTDASNRLTKWSITSPKKHTGISWERGKPAVEQLIERGFLSLAKGHTKAMPRYDFPTWQEILSDRAAHVGEWDRMTYEQIKEGNQPHGKTKIRAAESLARQGLVQQSADGVYRDLLQADLDPSADYIWLPNTLVTGTDRGKTPQFVASAARVMFGHCAYWSICTTPRISATTAVSVLESSAKSTSGS